MNMSCKGWEHRVEIFRGVHIKASTWGKEKRTKERENRKRAGIIVAVGIGLRKSFNATARNNQLT